MFKRITSIFLFLALASGIASGTPLSSEKMESEMPNCSGHRTSDTGAPDMSMVRLCCMFHCSNSAPVSSGMSINFSPTEIAVADSILKQIARFLKRSESFEDRQSFVHERNIPPKSPPPKYLQHHSFLI
jgi:hypothetical protein